MNLSESQQKVFDSARQKLKDKKWFRGICLDNFPDEQDCKDNFDDCVAQVCFETEMWDDPNFLNNI